ncbi:hypothetical protein ABPG75_010852 [Micractinium tetrahymenae]
MRGPLLLAAVALALLAKGAEAAFCTGPLCGPILIDTHCLPTHCDCFCSKVPCCNTCGFNSVTKQPYCIKCNPGWMKMPGGYCSRPPPPPNPPRPPSPKPPKPPKPSPPPSPKPPPKPPRPPSPKPPKPPKPPK